MLAIDCWTTIVVLCFPLVTSLGAPSTGEIWPLPKKTIRAGVAWSVDPENLRISITKPCNIVEEAVKRYKKKFCYNIKHPKSVKGKYNYITDLIINIKDCEAHLPHPGMNESYKLSIHKVSLIRAPESWGVLRALESFAQLMYYDKNFGCRINEVIIFDQPRFPHRGVLLDTSRHYLSLNALKATLELMAQNKFNVFHWHIVDEEAFPYASQVAEKFQKGAYSTSHIYTVNQIKELLEYARLRGIRVIPEFDTPGHTHSWGIGYPELLSRCFNDNGEEDPYQSLLDPSNEHTFDVISKLFEEAFEVFPDKYFHLGGDEAEFWIRQCWENNKNITTFMKSKGMANVNELFLYYMDTLLRRLSNLTNFVDKTFLTWQEVFDRGYTNSNVIVHVWKGNNEMEQMAEMAKITGQGYYAILSSCWYLDHIARRADWLDFYFCDPERFNGTEAQKKFVLGGEAALWGEYVDDSNVVSRLWPRASAVAERLWSDPATTSNPSEAWPRLYEMQCRMKLQGYPVQPVNGPSFCEIEYQTDLPV